MNHHDRGGRKTPLDRNVWQEPDVTFLEQLPRRDRLPVVQRLESPFDAVPAVCESRIEAAGQTIAQAAVPATQQAALQPRQPRKSPY
ncbi:MAG: hypothetical protein WCO99_14080 [Planctomycetota bacterium]